MRETVDRARLQRFLEELSRAARGATRLYLTGGASQLLRGLRDSTVDADLTLEPERDDMLRAMLALKESLNPSVEIGARLHA